MKEYVLAVIITLGGAIVLSVVIAGTLFIDVPQYNTPQSLFFLNLPLIIGCFILYFFGMGILTKIIFWLQENEKSKDVVENE